MSPIELVAILALVGYAVYRQTRVHEVVGAGRFKLAFIYAGVGLVSGGMHLPSLPAEQVLLLAGLALSAAVGLARGRLTRLWRDPDGRVLAQGTALTIALFLGMVATKFALGTWAWFHGLSDDGGFGEVLVMIGLMVAFQAEIVWRRGRALGARQHARDDAPAPVAH